MVVRSIREKRVWKLLGTFDISTTAWPDLLLSQVIFSALLRVERA